MIDHFNIPIEDLMAIQVQLTNRAGLQALAKAFQYEDSKSVGQNLRVLAGGAAGYLRLEGRAKGSFLEYMVEKNVPIEVTFKPLRAEQLQNMIEEWVSLHTESSTIIEKLYSNNHRNILFKRVLFEERETIDDYFHTLSEKNMLRGVDLYQLLVDILSPFHLYEHDADPETFFQKVNSLNSFLAVVNRFVHSEKRIAVGITAADMEYVRRFEFDRLIQFWEGENAELVLLSQRRKNHLEKETQTEERNVCDQHVQTQLNFFSLSQIINQALKALNKLTPDNDNVQELEAIDRIYSYLRKEKIMHLQEQHNSTPQIISTPHDEELEKTSQRTQKKSPTASLDFNFCRNKAQAGILVSLVDQINQNDTFTIDHSITHDHIGGKIEMEQKQIPSPHQHLLSPQQHHSPLFPSPALANTLRSIYNIYFAYKADSDQLHKCLSDLGVSRSDIQAALDCISHKDKAKHVSALQFQRAVQEVMIRDRDLTDKVLEDFLAAKLDEAMTPAPSYTSNLSRMRYRGFSSTYSRY